MCAQSRSNIYEANKNEIYWFKFKIQIGKRDGDKIDKNKFSEKYKNCPSRQENKILWGLEIGNLENLPPLSICA